MSTDNQGIVDGGSSSKVLRYKYLVIFYLIPVSIFLFFQEDSLGRDPSGTTCSFGLVFLLSQS